MASSLGSFCGPRTAWSGFWFFILICVLVVYFVLRNVVNERVDDATNFCSKDAASFDLFTDIPQQELQTWVYNLTNPGDYLLDPSANAKFEELGPFGYALDSGRKNVSFTGKSEVAFTLFNSMTPNQALSCDGCGSADSTIVTVPNTAYLALIQPVGNEATLLMAMTCSPQKIQLMYNGSSSIPYCTAQQAVNPTFICKCCYPTVGNTSAIQANSLPCSSLASLSSKNAHIVSWLSSYDNGYRINNVPSNNFILSSGSFSPLVRALSVTELLFGHFSALVGTISAGAAITNKDASVSSALMSFTQDLKDVCYRESLGLCPQVSQIMASFASASTPAAKLQVLRSATCTGTVPSYDVLIADLMSEERALELRYIEGVSCKPFSPAIVMASLIALNASNTYTCMDGSKSAPCCLRSFEVNVGNIKEKGGGIGCVNFVAGVLQRRRVYSTEEASEYLGSNIAQSTTCENDNPLMVKKWFNEESALQWIAPSSYAFPLMSWADPTVIRGTLTGLIPGSKQFVDYTSAHVANQMPTGSQGPSFLEPDLNDGSVAEESFEALVTTFSRVRTLKFAENTRVDGIQVARYDLVPLPEAGSETSQRAGELPYPNMINMAYSSGGRPVIISAPNYLHVDARIFDQSSNAPRSAVPGKSVEIYRMRDGYKTDSASIEPELITSSTTSYFADEFSNFWNFEPVTGLNVQFQMSTMMSTFTWNCNPNFDKNCEVMRNVTQARCYAKSINGAIMYTPCSATNVFTPYVQGQKVLPVYWSRVQSNAPDELSYVALLLSTKYGFSILCVIVPILLVLPVAIYTIMLRMNQEASAAAEPTADEDNLELEKVKAVEKTAEEQTLAETSKEATAI